jgi:hypothetical protein
MTDTLSQGDASIQSHLWDTTLDMHEREVAKQLKREGWYAWASNHDGIVFRIKRVRAKAGS